MNRKLLILTITTILLCVYPPSTTSAKQEGSTTIDELRARYLEIERTSWEFVTNDRLDQNKKLQEIFQEHTPFAIINLGVDYQENEFQTLNGLYDWKFLEKDLVTINNLFIEFRRNLERQTNEGFDETSSVDLAETILLDEHYPISETLQQIENIMINQALYYKANLVSLIIKHLDHSQRF